MTQTKSFFSLDAIILLIVLNGLFLIIPSLEASGKRLHSEISPVAAQSPSAIDIREELLDLLNSERVGRGLPALKSNEELNALALAHSQDMATSGLLSHESSDGKTYIDRLVGRGIYFQSAAENVASSETFLSAFVHKAFMNNPGHRDNILNPEFDRVGVGVSSADGRAYYVTQDFICSFIPQNQNTVREEARRLVGRILTGNGLPALEAFPAWDDLADALAQTKAEGRIQPGLPEGLGAVRVFFITTPSVETASGQFQDAVIGPYAGVSVGVALSRNAALPGGAYVIALLLFLKTS